MNIYLSGLGGVGIGPLAQIAFDAGHSVSGSDISESPLTEELVARGITVQIGQDGSFLRASHEARPIDWFVHTAALPQVSRCYSLVEDPTRNYPCDNRSNPNIPLQRSKPSWSDTCKTMAGKQLPLRHFAAVGR